jgi:hypothetical protein
VRRISTLCSVSYRKSGLITTLPVNKPCVCPLVSARRTAIRLVATPSCCLLGVTGVHVCTWKPTPATWNASVSVAVRSRAVGGTTSTGGNPVSGPSWVMSNSTEGLPAVAARAATVASAG